MSASADNNIELCPKCGQFVTPDNYNYDTGWCKECSPVHSQSFLEIHADHIEYYMLVHLVDARTAIVSVRSEVTNRCFSCGGPINHHAPLSAVFCRSNTRCIQAARRYKYLYQTKQLPKAQALAQTLNELESSDKK